VTVTGRVLTVIPARGGSVGLPGKNLRPFAGVPLMVHSILYAKLCPEITRIVVSTDSADIAAMARRYGAEVPFMRPPDLAKNSTPMWPVLRHALMTLEKQEGTAYDFFILLDPTSPAREPTDITEALQRLEQAPEADGIVSVSRPIFNPIWHCVVEREGWMVDLLEGGSRYACRQDVPAVYRINGALYVWRAAFVRREERGWRSYGKHLVYEIPEQRAMSIDDVQQFEQAEALVRSGQIHFPWLKTLSTTP
jgi:CMP-N,N'-diacetyllegionaminic acid synthase